MNHPPELHCLNTAARAAGAALPLLFAALGLAYQPAAAATECPYLRPPHLTEAQVQQTVLAQIEAATGRPADKIDPARTFQELDGTDNAPIKFVNVESEVSYALGFDAAAVFYKVAQAQGKTQIFDSVPIADLLSTSVRAYLAGHDSPAPPVSAGVTYGALNFHVNVPDPVAHWTLAKCNLRNVAFDYASDDRATEMHAIVQEAGLPVYTTADAFLATIKTLAGKMAQANGNGREARVQLDEGGPTPCARFELDDTRHGLPYVTAGRVCYVARDKPLGVVALYLTLGKLPLQQSRLSANAFFQGVALGRQHVRDATH